MNKHDIILIVLIVLISGGFLLTKEVISNNNLSKAYVYYDNKLLETLDLSSDEIKQYTVKGYNGDVVIETSKNKVRVVEEESPRHLCSKQGWVTSSFEPIVCLPNKIIIKIESTKEDVDAVLR